MRIAHRETANGIDAFKMTDASAVRTIQDTCCPAAVIVVRAENIFDDAAVEVIVHDQWLTIAVQHPHAEETNASEGVTSNRVDDSPCELCHICWEQGG